MATEEMMLSDASAPLPVATLTASQPAIPSAFSPPAPFDFAPKTLSEAMELSRMLAESTMVPKDFIGKPGNCFLAMQWGAELGMKPMQAIQNIAIINGKPGIYGDVGKAMLLSRGFQILEDDVRQIELAGVASCTVVAPGGARVTRTFSLSDAKTAGLWGKAGPWQTYPYRQMAWRAFWFAARDGAAHVLKGMAGVEELRDIASLEREVQGEVVQPEPPAAKPSRSAATAAKLKGPTAAEVLKAFADAKTPAELNEAVELAKKGVFTEGEKKEANAAYRAASARLSPPAEEDAPSLNEVKQMLGKATTLDELDVAASLIDKTRAEPDLKEAAKADYRALRAKLGPPA
jgi:hypothetical protein